MHRVCCRKPSFLIFLSGSEIKVERMSVGAERGREIEKTYTCFNSQSLPQTLRRLRYRRSEKKIPRG